MTVRATIGRSLAAAAGLVALAGTAIALAAHPALVELKVDGRTYQGKVAALGDEHCWLVERDGRLHRLAVAKIEAHRQVSARFVGFTVAEIRDRLRRELGGSFDVAASEHCLVAAGRDADRYAELIEDVYRSFHGHFSVRGFPMQSPEFPMVAVVYPSRSQFVANCEADGVSYSAGLVGYYHPTSNRVSLFDPGEADVSGARRPVPPRLAGPFFEPGRASRSDRPFAPPDDVDAWGLRMDLKAALRDTLIHETTHQAAFNTGLHSRIRENPRWIVEGLATVFEAPGIREAGGRQVPVAQRINRERYLRFGNYAKSRRPSKSLAKFLADDELLNRATLDFYAQSWALTFYLVETRSSAYAKYLKAIAARSPTEAYSGEQRLEDFRAAFGDDVERLEAEFLRYLERLVP